MPPEWWLRYALKKACAQPHWRVGGAVLLSHPGCLLSRHHATAAMLARVQQAVWRQRTTVLVTHWWEYFEHGRENAAFVRVLHDLAAWLAEEPRVRVVPFSALAEGGVPLD